MVVCWPRAVGLLTRLSVSVFVRIAWFRGPFLSLRFCPCDSLFWALVWVWSGLPRLSLLRVCFCLGSGRRFVKLTARPEETQNCGTCLLFSVYFFQEINLFFSCIFGFSSISVKILAEWAAVPSLEGTHGRDWPGTFGTEI